MKSPAKLLYGDSERCPDLRYVTGLFIPDPILWFEVASTRFIIVSPLEFNRARREADKRTTVMSYGDAKQKFGLKSVSYESQITGVSKYYGIKKWHVPYYFPYGLIDLLKRRGLTFKATRGPFFPEREFKMKSEIKKISDGVKLAEAGLERALQIINASRIKGRGLQWNNQALTSEIIKGEINATISYCGGSASETIVACGISAADPHDSGSGKIMANQPIIIDIFPRVTNTGYHGDLTRTVVKGTASEIVKRAFVAVQTAVNNTIDVLKSDVDSRVVHQTASKTLRHLGFRTDIKANIPYGFIHSTGHGLGLEIHEAPRIGRKKYILKQGHVVTVEPGLYYPEWGGVRIEDVVAIKKNGCTNLTTTPIYLEIP